jgi:hypothetical protein
VRRGAALWAELQAVLWAFLPLSAATCLAQEAGEYWLLLRPHAVPPITLSLPAPLLPNLLRQPLRRPLLQHWLTPCVARAPF